MLSGPTREKCQPLPAPAGRKGNGCGLAEELDSISHSLIELDDDSVSLPDPATGLGAWGLKSAAQLSFDSAADRSPGLWDCLSEESLNSGVHDVWPPSSSRHGVDSAEEADPTSRSNSSAWGEILEIAKRGTTSPAGSKASDRLRNRELRTGRAGLQGKGLKEPFDRSLYNKRVGAQILAQEAEEDKLCPRRGRLVLRHQ
mmetsp:Transcript_8100/g.20125  ORF Transcript_8100/g.20125 Transcript_8100/m.20125 type:complete len:200 (-) Transcript_8100:153-752(-)